MPIDFKNASADVQARECERIAAEVGDIRFGTKKELKHLPEILSDGEQLLSFASGFMNGHTWLITLTDRRIIFLDKGWLFGLRQAAIDLDKVNAVSGETVIIAGKISIEDGASTRTIRDVPKWTVVPFTNTVRDAIEARKAMLRAPAPDIRSDDDVISNLERLGALLDKGVINQGEFDAQKAKILQ